MRTASALAARRAALYWRRKARAGIGGAPLRSHRNQRADIGAGGGFLRQRGRLPEGDIRCGHGSNIDLSHYTSPDQQDMTPKNSDIGGYHIAIYVDDVQAAKDYLDSKGVKTFMGPIQVEPMPAAGQTILYFVAPWGPQLEAISYPQGMAYEKDSSVILWSPKDPSK